MNISSPNLVKVFTFQFLVMVITNQLSFLITVKSNPISPNKNNGNINHLTLLDDAGFQRQKIHRDDPP